MKSMKGRQQVRVSNRKATFKFELNRNITILCGDSGTGKTTLYNMIADYTRLKEASGVNLSSSCPCVALMDLDWKNQLDGVTESIVFIDEGLPDLRTTEFATAIKNSSNYYVLITREPLYELPYSVDEIYELKTSGKMHTFRKRYPSSRKFHRYTPTSRMAADFTTVLTEDARAGFQFFTKYFENTGVTCVAAAANSNIFKWLKDHPKEKTIVIADGAAFGAEMERVMKHCNTNEGARQLCLPESFEWLILKSGIVKIPQLGDILENTSNYVECTEFISWERFFADLLIQQTKDTPFQYQKGTLNPVYAQTNNREKIASEILDGKE